MPVDIEQVTAQVDDEAHVAAPAAPNWLTNVRVLWQQRRLLLRVEAIALLVSLGIVLLIPKQYQSTARIMPPERSGSEAPMMAALAGRALGGDLFGSLAASMIGVHNSGALFVDLLKSGSVTGPIIDRFHLLRVYHVRYRVDAGKRLARCTTIVQDKKSGVITITITDRDPIRARDLAQAYLDGLNLLVNRTSTSSAHQERVFIEHRLDAVKRDLERAQQAMSDFSSTHDAIDIREQTRATVDTAAKLEAELVVTQGELKSLQQIYGDGNIRVRAAEARLANLKLEMGKLEGSSAALPADSDLPSGSGVGDPISYPPLRQLPRLAVPYADLYRTVRVEENTFELLTQQYEMARVQEAKDIPVLSVIDAPGIPEKKSFPHRSLMTLAMTMIVSVLTCAWLILRYHWESLHVNDPRREFAQEIMETLNPRQLWFTLVKRRAA